MHPLAHNIALILSAVLCAHMNVLLWLLKRTEKKHFMQTCRRFVSIYISSAWALEMACELPTTAIIPAIVCATTAIDYHREWWTGCVGDPLVVHTIRAERERERRGKHCAAFSTATEKRKPMQDEAHTAACLAVHSGDGGEQRELERQSID